MRAVEMFARGDSRAEVAAELGVTWRSAHDWYKAWRRGGARALASKGKPGPQPKFDAGHAERLEVLLSEGAMAHGYENALWTIPRIRRLIAEHLGLAASGSEVWRLLRRMGWSSQKPAKRARERREAEIRRWKKETWPKILARASRERRTIVFVDESGLSMKPARKNTWAPRGQTPVLEFSFNWKKLSAIGGISFRQIYFRLHDKAITGAEVIEFVGHLRRHIRRKLLIVWDGLGAHWSREVSNHIESLAGRVVVERLPAYAPELNPVEYLWAQLKQHEMANLSPKDLTELSAAARKALRKVKRSPRYIRAFWIQAELPL